MEQATYVIRKEWPNRWHLYDPQGHPVYNGMHQPQVFAHYWQASAYCETFGLLFRFEEAIREEHAAAKTL